MPFVETCRMEERVRMLSDYDTGCFSVVELCRRYGVSRDTFYAGRARRASGAADWFFDRSHATRSCPHRTEEAMEAEIVALRRRFPHMGPRKLLAILARRRRRRPLDAPRRTMAAEAPNDEWAADFKGWFRTQDQRRGRSLDDHRQP